MLTYVGKKKVYSEQRQARRRACLREALQAEGPACAKALRRTCWETYRCREAGAEGAGAGAIGNKVGAGPTWCQSPRGLVLSKTGALGGFQPKKPRSCGHVRRLTPAFATGCHPIRTAACTHSAGGRVRARCSWVLAGPACLLISRSRGRTGLRGSTH